MVTVVPDRIGLFHSLMKEWESNWRLCKVLNISSSSVSNNLNSWICNASEIKDMLGYICGQRKYVKKLMTWFMANC